MASTKSTASTTISSGYFVKIDGKGIALVKQQVCRDGAVMYIVQVCGCDFDVEIDAKRVQTVTADSDSETKQTTGSSSRFKIVTDQEVNDFNIKQTNKNTLTNQYLTLEYSRRSVTNRKLLLCRFLVSVRKRDGGDTCW